MPRVAVIADTHLPRGSRSLPPHCLYLLGDADLILHAGDFTGTQFLAELRALGVPLQAVHGNMDEPALRAELPAQTVVEAFGTRIGMLHIPGARAGREGRLAARFAGCDAVVYGHTHLPQAERQDGMWILNPGSPTERRRAPVRSMLMLELRGRRIEPELIELSP